MNRFEFARATSIAEALDLVSAAVALRAEGGIVREARIVLGAVATLPLRSPAAERALVGRRLDGAAAVAGAQPLSDNGYKVELARTLLRRVLAATA